MWISVVPAHNEADSIEKVLKNIIFCNFHRAIIVANGCNDSTEEKILRSAEKIKLDVLSFPEPLGIDIPRAVGAAYAKKYNPRGIVFIDGDMAGDITFPLQELLKGIEQGLDLALTNCYPYNSLHSDLANTVLKYRKTVNKALGLTDKIGLATPSHGPHAISARLLSEIPIEALAIPPLVLAFAAKNNFEIGLATTITHELLGSKIRSTKHATNIAATIIGDCKQTLSYIEGVPLPEVLKSTDHISEYRKARRFDLLANAMRKQFS